MEQKVERTHTYHAEATVIEGHLTLPFHQQIGRQAHVSLAPEGGYFSRRLDNFRLGEVISIRSGYTQVAGNKSKKEKEGWDTLVTFVAEGVNVLEVLPADRVVGQMIIEHPLEGYVPRINFLGTRFENLRIAGHPVHLDLDLGILGARPRKDASYGSDSELKDRVSAQYARIRKQKNLPAELADHYKRLSSTLGNREAVELSLVNQATGAFAGTSFGHKIHIPDFGWITLAKVRITHEDFIAKTDVPRKTTVHLTMIDLKLGCTTEGSVPIGSGSGNGGSGG